MPHQCTNCGHTFADGSKEMLSGCPECGGNKFQFHPGDIPEDADVDGAAAPERPGTSGVSSAVGKAAATVRDFVRDDPDAGAPETGGSGARGAESAPDAETASDAEVSSSADGDAGSSTPADGDADAPPDRPATEATTPSERDADTPETPETEDGAAEDADGATDADTAADAESASGAEAADDSEDAAQASARSEMVTSDDLPTEPPSDGRVVKEPDADAEEPDMEALREELNDQFESIKVLAPGQYELNLMELYDREEYIIALQENGRYVIEVPETFAGPVARDEE
ncbi:hypothetical protein EFA46_003935 [Halarchaeum sp. CBA1220]|uniref:OapC/ArvC family zinc-ribbon domain-containing protein n=1 Tax=Halarchaeum sp. CBA1220 TaxID=1853682 RepID=UPI000F3A882A|nr:Zn-ribbon containing protein [Halarchaeum sp. CBA1220]QLC33384.1 hypothetical protein EFA46_003935 [Halarchaeum sp. CBA1220]